MYEQETPLQSKNKLKQSGRHAEKVQVCEACSQEGSRWVYVSRAREKILQESDGLRGNISKGIKELGIHLTARQCIP